MVFQEVKRFGSHFAFEMFLETFQPQIIDALRKWLKPLTPGKLRRMVQKRKYPDASGLDFGAATGYLEYLEKISVVRLLEDYLGPARPDLVKVIQEMGKEGAEWIVRLHAQLLDYVSHPENAPVPKGAKQDLVMASCDACGKRWPVPRPEFSQIKECPFCGHGAQEEAAPEAETPPAEGEPSTKSKPVIDIEEDLEHNID